MPVLQRRENGDVFEMRCELVDVTSLHRPDTSWRYVDKAGHEHRWFADGQPATSYNPSAKHDAPSLIWVKDGEEYWEGDDEPHDVGHLECRTCREHIEPSYTADITQQYIAGLKHFSINGESVSLEEFQRRYDLNQ